MTISERIPFEPKGAKAEWALIYDRIKDLAVGDVITYVQLDGILGRDFVSARSPFYTANERLLKERKRGLVCVSGTGYRVVSAIEHEQVARKHHKSGTRKLRRSAQWIHNVDRAKLDPETLARFDAIDEQLQRQIDFTRRLNGRVMKLDKALKQTREETAASTEETKERLTAIEELVRRKFPQDFPLPDGENEAE